MSEKELEKKLEKELETVKWVKNPIEINNIQKEIYKKYLNEYLKDRDIETNYYDQDDWFNLEIDFWNWLSTKIKEK